MRAGSCGKGEQSLHGKVWEGKDRVQRPACVQGGGELGGVHTKAGQLSRPISHSHQQDLAWRPDAAASADSPEIRLLQL